MKFDDTLMLCVRKDLASNRVPMLLGEPGIGKSSWVDSLAFLDHTKGFTLPCNQLADKADLTGARLVPTDDTHTSYKQVFYPHAVISDCIEYAKDHPRENPILFLDELNRTTPDVTSELLSIPTMRSIGSVKLPDNIRVIIAGNDKGNVVSLDEASISRFVLYRVVPDTQTFLGLHADLYPCIKTVLERNPETIFCKTLMDNVVSKDDDDDDEDKDNLYIDDIFDDDDGMSQITTPRTIAALSSWLNGFTNQELLELMATTNNVDGEEISVLRETVEGHVGHTIFSALLLAEIASTLTTSSQTTQAVVQIGKPAVYDDLKSKTDIQSLLDAIGDLSEEDKSGCLLYALYEREDNKTLINNLTTTITSFQQNDLHTLMRLAADDKLDRENVQTFLETDTVIAQSVSIMFSFTD